MGKRSDTTRNPYSIWNKQHVEKVKGWLKSEAGLKQAQIAAKNTTKSAELFDSMNIVNPDQLREPYTI